MMHVLRKRFSGMHTEFSSWRPFT